MTTLLTDYRGVYVEESHLGAKFSQLNPKLKGPDDVLLSKVREVLKSDSSKHQLETNAKKSAVKVSVENTVGKRLIKWVFDGKLLDDGGNTVSRFCTYRFFSCKLL